MCAYHTDCPVSKRIENLYINDSWIISRPNVVFPDVDNFLWLALGHVYDIINKLRPRQMDAISQTTFKSAFSWMKMFES